MKGKFITLNKRNGGCPVCQGTDGDCRQSDDDRDPLYLCHPSRGDVSGFNFIGETSDGVWGKYFIDRGDSWKEEREPRNNRVVDVKKEKETESKPTPLSAEQRHQFYSEIFSQLTLNDKDKADLIRRGLSDQDIKDGCFVSINPFTLLKKNYSNLPGINGNKFITAGAGYLVPVKDIDGLFVGFQIRLYVTEGKYRWAKDCHTLEYSELPLQHCINNPDDIWVNLLEGTNKPFIGAKRLNTNTIGASGGHFASSEKTLINSVNRLKDKTFRLCPDAGSKANSLVLNHYRKLNKILTKLGLTLWVLDYGQGFDKSMPDFDELDVIPAIARTIRYSDWDVLAWLDIPSDADLNDEDPDNWKTQQVIRSHYSWTNSEKFTPDITIDANKCPPGLFIDHKDKSKSVGFPGPRQGLGLKLHTGQGKTTRTIKELCTNYSGIDSIYTNHRNSLGDQFVKDVDSYIDANDGSESDRFYMLNNINNTHYPRLVLAFDSLIKFTPSDFDGKIIILDEVESSLRHITGGGTIGERQREIMSLFEEALRRCHSVILADANLTDRTCQFIEKLSGIKITKVGNKRLPARPKVTVFDETKGNPKYLIGLAYKEAFPWIMVDSKVDSTTICRDAWENYGKAYLEINADTINDDENTSRKKWIRAFLENPNIVDHGDFPYDGIVSSPTIESGLSSTSKRFSGVYLFIKHLESLYSSQMIMRSRNIECPRYLSIKDFCIGSDYDSSLKSPFEKQLAKNHIEATVMAQELFISGKISREKLVDILTETVTDQLTNPWTDLYFYHRAITNYEKQNLKACALEVLQNHGFDITIAPLEDVDEHAPSPAYTKVKRTVKLEDSTAVFNADEITLEQYDRLNKRTDLKPKEKASVERFRLLEQLPEIDSDGKGNWSVDIVHHIKYKNNHAIKQAELRTLCTIEELANLRSAKSWEKVLKGQRFLGSFKDNYLVVRTLVKKDVLGLLVELVGLAEYTNETPEVKAIWEQWTRKDAIATKIDRGAKPITLVKRLASRLGFITHEIKTDRDDENRYFTLADNFASGYESTIIDYVKVGLGQELERRQAESTQDDFAFKEDLEQIETESCHNTQPESEVMPLPVPVPIPDAVPDTVTPPATIKRGVVKGHLNDYLLEIWCDNKMGKKRSEGKTLLDEAIRYCQGQLGTDEGEIATMAYDLAMANKLILISPAIMTTA